MALVAKVRLAMTAGERQCLACVLSVGHFCGGANRHLSMGGGRRNDVDAHLAEKSPVRLRGALFMISIG